MTEEAFDPSKVRSIRSTLGWSQDGLAERCGVTRPVISRLENGTFRDDLLVKVIEVFNTEITKRRESVGHTMEDVRYAEFFQVGSRQPGSSSPAVGRSRARKVVTLRHPPCFVDRDAELKRLAAAWLSGETAVLQIVGPVGVGKTALVARWLHQNREILCNSRRFEYQFKSPLDEERHFEADKFLSAALEFFGDANAYAGTSEDKVERLVQLVRTSQTLLVLDGFHTLHVTGPQNTVSDEGVAMLLRRLADQMDGLCIVTARRRSAELSLPIDSTASRVQTLELSNLTQGAGAALLAELGVRGESRRLECAADSVDGHPRLLVNLAQEIVGEYSGEIENWRLRRPPSRKRRCLFPAGLFLACGAAIGISTGLSVARGISIVIISLLTLLAAIMAVMDSVTARSAAAEAGRGSEHRQLGAQVRHLVGVACLTVGFAAGTPIGIWFRSHDDSAKPSDQLKAEQAVDSYLFKGVSADDISRLEGATIHDVVPLCLRCESRQIRRFGEMFEDDAESLLKIVQQVVQWHTESSH